MGRANGLYERWKGQSMWSVWEMERAGCGLYERWKGQSMWSVWEMEWAGHVVCMRDGMGRACGLYERWNGHSMWFVWEMEWARHVVCTRDKKWRKNTNTYIKITVKKAKYHMEHLSTGILKWVSRYMVWCTGFLWLRTANSGRPLWTWRWTYSFHTRPEFGYKSDC